MNKSFWDNKRVLLTGHTGFKGGWLSLWLQSMGAKVHGYALEPATQPNFFTLAKVADAMTSNTIADIRDMQKIKKLIDHVKPEIVFHMAAQPLVRFSYAAPEETYAVNIMGTVNLLEAIRYSLSVKAVVNITTDKCYENREQLWAYRENDALGGYDPYSSSKACSEIITAAYRQSFLAEKAIGVATARAGNVIGGGDWSNDRLIPDFFRALARNQPLIIRSPNAIRPWQHVLEPLSGYLKLAEKLYIDPGNYATAWNFGPSDEAAKTVSWILTKLSEKIPNAKWGIDKEPQLHEAGLLKLDSCKAKELLNWSSRWTLQETLSHTVEWHNQFNAGANLKDFSNAQIATYMGAIS
jgi:CDP-glucose 4,6-dehydratase